MPKNPNFTTFSASLLGVKGLDKVIDDLQPKLGMQLTRSRALEYLVAAYNEGRVSPPNYSAQPKMRKGE